MPSLWDTKIAELSGLLDSLIGLGAQISPPQVTFPTIAALLADTTRTSGMADSTLIRVLDHDGFDLIKVSSGTVHYTAATGSGFRIRMDVARPAYFGAQGDDTGLSGTNDKAALDAALASDAQVIDLAGLRYFYAAGDFAPSKPVINGRVRDTAGEHDYTAVTFDSGPPVRQTTDWDTAVVSGNYWSNGTAANRPGTGTGAVRGVVIAEDSQNVLQLVGRPNDGAILFRQKSGGSFSVWRDLMATCTRRQVVANFTDWIDIAMGPEDAVHVLIFENLRSEVALDGLRARLTADGSTYLVGNDYRSLRTRYGQGGAEQRVQTSFEISGANFAVNSAVGFGVSGQVQFFGMAQDARTRFQGSVTVRDSNSGFDGLLVAGEYENTPRVHNGVRLFFAGGRIASGRVIHLAFKGL